MAGRKIWQNSGSLSLRAPLEESPVCVINTWIIQRYSPPNDELRASSSGSTNPLSDATSRCARHLSVGDAVFTARCWGRPLFHKPFTRSTNMNVFRLTGDLSHLAAIIILLLKIWKSRSCAGERALGTSTGCFSLCELRVWVKSVWGIVYVAADPLVCVVNSCTRPHLSELDGRSKCWGLTTLVWVLIHVCELQCFWIPDVLF